MSEAILYTIRVLTLSMSLFTAAGIVVMAWLLLIAVRGIKQELAEYRMAVNSRMDQLIAEVRTAAFAAGRKEEKDNPT
jgi:hypothetical protein